MGFEEGGDELREVQQARPTQHGKEHLGHCTIKFEVSSYFNPRRERSCNVKSGSLVSISLKAKASSTQYPNCNASS